MSNVGFVGLGVMGAPMAGHLLKRGNSLTVWARSPEKSQALAEQGAVIVRSLEELARRCDTVFLCVTRNEDVEQCVHGLQAGMRPGLLVVDHSTVSPDLARRMYVLLKSHGGSFLDAPITGGSMGAQKGQLTIFCGGDLVDYEQATPIMDAYTKRAELVGPSGAGQTMKLANQIAVGGALLALCESLSFAKKAGLDIALTREMLSTGAAGSWAFDNYGPKILAEDWSPGFSVKNQRKDFAYTLEAAKSLNSAVPGTALVDRLLAQLEDEGHSEWTTAALFETLVKSGFDTWM